MLTLRSSRTCGDGRKRVLHTRRMTSELWQRIQRGRKHAALTQDVVAKTCGTSRNAVSLWEAENPALRATPTVPNLVKMAKLLAESTKSHFSDVAGWLLDDNVNPEVRWREAPKNAAVAEPVAPYDGKSVPKKASKLVEHFTRLSPVVQEHIIGIVDALALPADPRYTEWEAEQQRKNHVRDNRHGKLGLMSDDAGDTDSDRYGSGPPKPGARRAKKK